jgi:hypothetical protein
MTRAEFIAKWGDSPKVPETFQTERDFLVLDGLRQAAQEIPFEDQFWTGLRELMGLSAR